MGCVQAAQVSQSTCKDQNPEKSLDQLLAQIKAIHPQYDVISLRLRFFKVIEALQSLSYLKEGMIKAYLTNWSSKNTTAVGQRLQEDIIAVIMLGVKVAFNNKIPKATQIISLLLTISNQQGVILEVKTGEGKTMIIAMVALYYALLNKKVDIITSSQVLALREGHPESEVCILYDLFGKKCCSNVQSIDNKLTPSAVYDCPIIYGTSLSFQAALLKKMFRKINIYLKDRNFDQNHICLVDEVDSLLIDKIADSTRLTVKKPSYEGLRLVFCLIWTIYEQVLKVNQSQIYENQITINGFTYSLADIAQIKNTKQKQQVYAKFIQNVVRSLLSQKVYKNYFPQFLAQYISKNLNIWILNAFRSKSFKKKHQYTRIADQKDPENDRIIKVDFQNTGVFQMKMTLANGVHQFIQLNQHLQPSVESLVTNFESNFIYFQRYNKIIGFTGTLGDQIYSKFLSENYQVRIMIIPTMRKRLLLQEQMRLDTNRQEWIKRIVNSAIEYANDKKRSVLIISQTISLCEELKQQIRKVKKDQPIVDCFDHLRYWEFQKQQSGKQGNIIVASNLAGRGTDIKISKQVASFGGLYVILTFFPKNTRVEQQAFGRAARNGQKGSGAFYLHSTRSDDLTLWKSLNNDSKAIYKAMDEKRLLTEFNYFQSNKKTIQKQKNKKQLLEQFIKNYIDPIIVEISRKQQEVNAIKSKIGQQSQYVWALYEKYALQDKKDQLEQDWGLFLRYKELEDPNSTQINLEDFQKMNKKQNPGYIIRTVIKFFLQSYNSLKYTKKELQRVVQMNQNWIPHYYLVYAFLRQQNVPQALKHLEKTLALMKRQMVIETAIMFEVKFTRSSEHFTLWEKEKGEFNEDLLKRFNYKLYLIANEYESMLYIRDFLMTNPQKKTYKPVNYDCKHLYNQSKVNFLIEEGLRCLLRLNIQVSHKYQPLTKQPLIAQIIGSFSKLIGQPLLCYVLQNNQLDSGDNLDVYLKKIESKYAQYYPIMRQFIQMKNATIKGFPLQSLTYKDNIKTHQVDGYETELYRMYFEDEKNPVRVKKQFKDLAFVHISSIIFATHDQQSIKKLLTQKSQQIQASKTTYLTSQIKQIYRSMYGQNFTEGNSNHQSIKRSLLSDLLDNNKLKLVMNRKQIKQLVRIQQEYERNTLIWYLSWIINRRRVEDNQSKIHTNVDGQLRSVKKQQELKNNFLYDYSKPADKFEFELCLRSLRDWNQDKIIYLDEYFKQNQHQVKVIVVSASLMAWIDKEKIQVKIYNTLQLTPSQTQFLDQLKQKNLPIQTFTSKQQTQFVYDNILYDLFDNIIYRKQIDEKTFNQPDKFQDFKKLHLFYPEILKIAAIYVSKSNNYYRDSKIPVVILPLERPDLIQEIRKSMWILSFMSPIHLCSKIIGPLLKHHASEKQIQQQKKKVKFQYPQYWELINNSTEKT